MRFEANTLIRQGTGCGSMLSLRGAYNFAEYKDMLEHAGFTGIGDANLVDLRIQPVKASKRPQDV
jgi:hypothetical protein